MNDCSTLTRHELAAAELFTAAIVEGCKRAVLCVTGILSSAD